MISDRVALPDPVVAAQPAPNSPAVPELQYAKTPSGVTRRQMNLLLLFVVIVFVATAAIWVALVADIRIFYDSRGHGTDVDRRP